MLMQTSWSQLLAPRSVLQSIKGRGDRSQTSVWSQEFELAILAPTVMWLLSQLNGKSASQVISAELHAHM